MVDTEFIEGLDAVICHFTLASHLFWGSWAVVQAGGSTNKDFDYLDYARLRFEGYYYHRKEFFPYL
jgi:hypothetical protein